jgi:catechol 2,3-dioxygenase-like lactoylglutathione lyase family enzyme
MPSITGYTHAELSVSNLDRSVDWYRELFQAREIFREPNVPEDIVAVALLEPVSKMVIAFTQHLHPVAGNHTPKRPGIDHLSFGVAERSELDAWRVRLDELGVDHDGVKDNGRSAWITFRDPDGIGLEFFHVVRRATQANGGG